MEDAPALERLVRELLASQRLAVLSTETRGTPYSSLIVFAAAPDLTALVFATPRPTRKFSNLSENARVSLLVDNRSNREEDFAEATAGGGVAFRFCSRSVWGASSDRISDLGAYRIH
jgi:hypothetical protein